MSLAKIWLCVIILCGGIAVLGSYGLGILLNPQASEMLWSGVPQNIRPYYTVNMFLAASGFFLFTSFILFRLELNETKINQRMGYSWFIILFTGILIPSALWLPLTVLAVEQGSFFLSWGVRLTLAIVGLSSLGLFYTLVNVKTSQQRWSKRLAVIGSLFFCFQTVILDALVWSIYFKV